MFRLYLALRKKNDNEIELHLPIGFRIMFLAIVIFLVASMVSTGSSSTMALILTAFSVLAGLYKEQWSFNRATGVIEHQSGLLFPYRSKKLNMSDVESFILSYTSGASRESILDQDSRKVDYDTKLNHRAKMKSVISFGLMTKSGTAQTIEIRRTRTTDDIEENAQNIADFCSIPIEIQQ
ncbi:MAG: hypothetical protein CMN78_01035 [Spirochaetales bacterium]|nr:hypothetical protein [Spirochaetales bacterium]